MIGVHCGQLIMAFVRYGHNDYCDKSVIAYFKFFAWRLEI